MRLARPYGIGVVGLGKIAREKHLPAIAADPDFELAAICDPFTDTLLGAPALPHFRDHQQLVSAEQVDVVAICTPPSARFRIAMDALAHGKHVLLEKPPTTTLAELAHLQERARDFGRVVFATWHSRFNIAVKEARRELADAAIADLSVHWKTDFHKWHPGQRWIWQSGGFGVFDGAINALSILTSILPGRVTVRAADLYYAANAQNPIAAQIDLAYLGSDASWPAEFDWRAGAGEQRDIIMTTKAGDRLQLSGGTELRKNGVVLVSHARQEYPRVYRHFADLLLNGESDVDPDPLGLVVQAIDLGRRVMIEPLPNLADNEDG